MSSTTIAPGKSAELNAPFTMSATMGGPHTFEFHLITNDPLEPEKLLYVKANFVP